MSAKLPKMSDGHETADVGEMERNDGVVAGVSGKGKARAEEAGREE